ncbi:hypothetical protein DFO53_4076 [Enterobacter sp. AG5470]|nr:hypothetical protein DFO53_4076 [Enterobacter sp. AG5470]
MFWFCICPKCYGQGRLVIKRSELNGRLFFNCDECDSSWFNEKDIGDSNSVFLGHEVPSSFATENDIQQAGWGKYMKNVYIK